VVDVRLGETEALATLFARPQAAVGPIHEADAQHVHYLLVVQLVQALEAQLVERDLCLHGVAPLVEEK